MRTIKTGEESVSSPPESHPPADHRLDIRNIPDSFALLKITQIFRRIGIGETVEILGCDAETRNDLFRILPGNVYHLLPTGDRAEHRMILKKRGQFEYPK